MRLIHKVPFSPQEIETFRQIVFDNIVRGFHYVLEAMDEMQIQVSPENAEHLEVIETVADIPSGEPFPMRYYEPLKALWTDPNVEKTWERGNEAALPEKCAIQLLSLN